LKLKRYLNLEKVKNLEKSKLNSAAIAIVLAVLMISSAMFAFSAPVSSVKAQTTSTNLLQYEWPSVPGDPSFQRYSAGPAPDSFSMLWNVTIPGLGTSSDYPVAFNGKVFVAWGGVTGTTSAGLLALNAQTGAIVWNATLGTTAEWTFPTGAQGALQGVPGGMNVAKLDDTYMIAGRYCLRIADGSVVWNSLASTSSVSLSTAKYGYDATLQAGRTTSFQFTTSWGSGMVYDPVSKRVFTGAEAWDFSNPTQPPTLLWSNTNKIGEGIGVPVYGMGIVTGGSSQAHYLGVNATTGQLLWDTECKGEMGYGGSYFNGMVIRGGTTDNVMYCFNITTGKIIWMFNPGTWYGFWASGTGIAYGNVYEINNDHTMYAINIATGKLSWAYPCEGIYYQGYPCIADGKIYFQSGTYNAQSRVNGATFAQSTYSCLDAFTGKLIWNISIEVGDPFSAHCIAYGNLYLEPKHAGTSGSLGSAATTSNQVWCIGSNATAYSMFRDDASGSQTAYGQAGPANLNLMWSYQTNGAIVASPVAANGKVYVGSQDKNMYCFDSWSGALLWNYTTGSRIRGSAAVANGKVYVQPDDEYLYCFNADTGSLLWKKDTGASTVTFDPYGFNNPIFSGNTAPIRASPIVFNGLIYVGSLANKTYCFDSNGNQIWTFNTEAQVVSTPVVYNNALYFSCRGNGSIYKVNLLTGALLWRYQVPGTNGQNGSSTVLMNPSPTIANGVIYYPCQSAFWYAINETTGSLIWRFYYRQSFATVNTYSMLFLQPSTVVFIDRFTVTAVNASTGYLTTGTVTNASGNPTVLWTAFMGREVSSSPIFAQGSGYGDGRIYVSTDSRQIYSLNATDGTTVGFFTNNELSAGWSSAAVYNGHMYVGNANWYIYAFTNFPQEALPLTVISSGTYVKTNVALTISGQVLPPAVPNFNLTVSVGFGNVRKDYQVTTDASGKFSISYTPTADGLYSYLVWTNGYKYYGPSYSDTHYFAAST